MLSLLSAELPHQTTGRVLRIGDLDQPADETAAPFDDDTYPSGADTLESGVPECAEHQRNEQFFHRTSVGQLTDTARRNLGLGSSYRRNRRLRLREQPAEVQSCSSSIIIMPLFPLFLRHKNYMEVHMTQILVGVLEALMSLPEVAALADVPAGPAEHHPEGSALAHTRLVVSYGLRISDCDSLVAAACALHDIGKACTPKGKWPHHHGHHEASERLAGPVCDRLGLTEEEKNFVLTVCHYHHTMHRALECTDKAWRRIFRALDWDREMVQRFVWCCQADHFGRGGQLPLYPEADYAMNKFDELVLKPH